VALAFLIAAALSLVAIIPFSILIVSCVDEVIRCNEELSRCEKILKECDEAVDSIKNRRRLWLDF